MNQMENSEKIISCTGIRKTVEYIENKKTKYKTVDIETGYIQEERTQEEETQRRENLQTIKNIYQTQSTMTKTFNFITGKKPDWKEIEEYTKEELDFLLQLKDGNTKYQKQRNDRKRKQLEKKYTTEEIEEKIEKSNQEDFYQALKSLGSLEIQKEINNRCK